MKNQIDIYSDNPPDTLEYKVAVMTAALDPKALVMYRHVNGATWWLATPSDVKWNWRIYQYRISPSCKPKKTVPLEASDLPAVCWVKFNKTADAMLVDSVSAKYFGVVAKYCFNFTQAMLSGMEYSPDRVNWKPMSKEISE